MGILEFASATIALAVVLGYLSDRLNLSPFPGFLLAGLLMKYLAEGTNLPALFGIDFQAVSLASAELLLFGSILIAFEVGREVGSVGFDLKAASMVLLEAATILGLTLLVTRIVGLTTTEGLVIATAFLSSSTVTVYKLTSILGNENAKRVALSMTTAEDVVLLAALSLITGGGRDPLVVFTLMVLLTLISAPLFHLVFRFLKAKEEYGTLIALSLTLAYASVAQFFASPLLGAFVAGYVFSRSVGGKGTLGPIVDLIAMLYLVSVGISTPLTAEVGAEMLILVSLVVLAIVVRLISVFLATLLTLGSPFYATVMSLHMASISELSPLVALSAYSVGLIKETIAVPLVLLPLLTIAISSFASRYWEKVAFALEERMTFKVPPLVPEELYEIGKEIALSSAKISGMLISVPLLVFLLKRLGFQIFDAFTLLLLLPLLLVVAFFIYREYNNMIRESVKVGSLPTILIRALMIAAVVSISTHTLVEVVGGSPEPFVIALLMLATLSLLLLISATLNAVKAVGDLIFEVRRGSH
ncbi:MAG: cation:proton antiporter [Acidilobaceae archaeon]|nr:cation:proton antiporter [Acidilobaceae archaeon]MCX8165541.1 cation:proton antiporter [Acidilobaceae archaeon]MDW7973968.1 cation:proton antiporter [Sulfolobales archaeon]